MTVNGPEPRQYRQSAIDQEFYIERQIAPIADSILVFKSTSMKELLDKQIDLFEEPKHDNVSGADRNR